MSQGNGWLDSVQRLHLSLFLSRDMQINLLGTLILISIIVLFTSSWRRRSTAQYHNSE